MRIGRRASRRGGMSLFASAIAMTAALFAPPAAAVVQLYDEVAIDRANAPEVDYRIGRVLPTQVQLDAVKGLQAKVQWNRFGTVHTLQRSGGYLATGLSGTPAQAARDWLRQNRALFRLSAQGVDDLELVNEGVTPFNEARAILFRQKFSGIAMASDGLITVGIVGGKVYYVSSSSAGDEQPPAGAATLSPLQAWIKAAANVNRHVPTSNVKQTRDQTKTSGWTVFKVLGFSDQQRARLRVMALPQGGVRQVYETIVLDSQHGAATAYVHYIDAQTGQVLRRENRVYNAAADIVPQPFSGVFPSESGCDALHEFSVGAGNAALNITASAILPTNGLTMSLYFKGLLKSQLVASGKALTGPAEIITYAPTGGVPEGTYQVEACSSASFVNMEPYNYVGVFIASPIDTSVTSPVLGADANAPQWKWFTSNPDINYDGADIRKVTCFAPLPEGGLSGCDIDSSNVAARAPWDTLEGGLIPTFTTIGNAAITAGDSLSPLTPSVPNLPLSVTRKYDFPFNNAWYNSGCSLAGIVASQVPQSNGNDINAVTVNLFTMHNRMHDFSYFLGFTERNYNMQLSNFGLTPLTQQNDPEVGSTQAGALGGMPGLPTFGTLPGRNNANQISLMDGVPGITNQYLFQPVGGLIYPPCTDGALDTGIAGHEYTHAISNRMVGGPDANLSGLQAGSMGESWSDLNATEYQAENGFVPPSGYKLTALAAYTTGNKERGIRDYALDDNPLNYGNLGFDTPGPEVHSDGEIWNGTQWELRQALIDQYNAQFSYDDADLQKACASGKNAPEACPGNRRWIQLIYDAWLLMPATATMLDARDAMLAADMARFGGANQALMWKVFAHRGMGEFAYSESSDDVETIPNFESPLSSDEANVSFKVVAGDESNAPVKARILVGRFATRTRQIADTDDSTVVDATDDITSRKTRINRDIAALVPATYEFTVIAPGYGIHHFTQKLEAGNTTLTFTLPSNWASASKGATVATSATVDENIAAAPTLIDDSEDSGAIIGDDGLVAGAYATIALAGGEHSVSRMNISTAAGPTNAGRWGALRSFEIRSCSGACTDAVNDFKNVAYTSADDAFPGGIPRPLQPDLNLRTFTFAAIKATHLQLRVLTSQCTGGPAYQGDTDSDPLNNTDCPSSSGLISGLNLVLGGDVVGPAPASYVRATDIQVFSSAPAVSTQGASGGGSGVPGASSKDGAALGPALLLPLLLMAGLRRRKTLH
ncbi:M36 family metallopeptidase [Hydrocarboniphaga sp.]|uniref:M36 family metallopeptidase n=1 Tax=Hydrocarboniphaga sp. TaxID=2033016 RepID=UPI003D0E0024